MDLKIRQETKEDYSTVFQVIHEAFKDEPLSDQSEPLLVEKLRKSKNFIPELSLVAEIDQVIVGHIILTPIQIIGKSKIFETLALAPVSVLPVYQRQGIGSSLIHEAHKTARRLTFKSIVLIGHKDYYPKFGYQKASDFDISFPFDARDENRMAIELVKGALKDVSGMVTYPAVFFEI